MDITSAPVCWFEKGFALGAAGGKPTQRKGQPRLKAMRTHWKRGIEMGAFCRQAFTHSYRVELSKPSALLKLFGGV